MLHVTDEWQTSIFRQIRFHDSFARGIVPPKRTLFYNTDSDTVCIQLKNVNVTVLLRLDFEKLKIAPQNLQRKRGIHSEMCTGNCSHRK